MSRGKRKHLDSQEDNGKALVAEAKGFRNPWWTHQKYFEKISKYLLTNRTKCAIIIMLRETKTKIDPFGYSIDTLNIIWVCSSVGRTQNF